MAPAWKSTEAATNAAGEGFFPSGNVFWGLDVNEDVFGAYGIPYQPVSVLIAHDQTVYAEWAGMRSSSEVEALLDEVVALAG